MLQAEDITVTYGRGRDRVTAVRGASLSLGEGQRLGLTGQSGSGKSTLAQVLSLLRKPDSGRVSVDGRPVTGAGLAVPRQLRRQVQLLWQSPRAAIDPRLRLDQVVLEPLAAQGELPPPGERDELLGDVATAVGLTDELLVRYPHEVSDGQLQRAALARALVLRPAYLICDEPAAMLDVSTQASLLAVLAQRQAAEGTGILLITHDRVLAEHWCHEVRDVRDLSAEVSGSRGRFGGPGAG